MEEIKLLQKACNDSSQGKVAIKLGISKASVNLLLKDKYPNPVNMYKKIRVALGGLKGSSIVGVDVGNKSLEDLKKELEL